MNSKFVTCLLLILFWQLLQSAQADQKVILVTGASKGIGKELVLQLATEPETYRVYGTWNSKAPDPLLFPGVQMLKMNQTHFVDIKSVIETIKKNEGRLDILVNNAGIGVYGPLEVLSEGDIRTQFDVNVIGPMLLMKAALPVMRENNFGRVFNVSSLAGAVGIPFMDAYSGSKFALEGACAAMEGYLAYMDRSDGSKWNLHCQVVEPGYTQTDFKKAAILPGPNNMPEHFQQAWDTFHKKTDDGMANGQDPSEVARIIKSAIDLDKNGHPFRIQTKPDRAVYMKQTYGITLDFEGESLVMRKPPRHYEDEL